MNVLEGPRLLANERYMAIAPGALGFAHIASTGDAFRSTSLTFARSSAAVFRS
jgi:hypothetical protein